MKEKTVSEVMGQMGSKSGKRRMETMTTAERSRIAKKAAAASAKVRTKKAKKRAPGHEAE
jgi:hypothetical protein